LEIKSEIKVENESVDVKEEVDSTKPNISMPEPQAKKRKLGKDPTIDTSFLPDKEREEIENKMREQLRAEWAVKQELMKKEPIKIAFSYWDGSGHRRDLTVIKGNTIAQFLQKAIEVLRTDFNELKTVSSDSLMFVKEDVIIPHFYSFYDFIVTKAMGKTGPLYEFDAAGVLNIGSNVTESKQESHPAKIVLRSWYEKAKHIYPASRWEAFVPHKKYDENYRLPGIGTYVTDEDESVREIGDVDAISTLYPDYK